MRGSLFGRSVVRCVDLGRPEVEQLVVIVPRISASWTSASSSTSWPCVETANFTRAAERVHISQSGVSARFASSSRSSASRCSTGRAGRCGSPTAGAAVARRTHAPRCGGRRGSRDRRRARPGLVHGHVAVGMVTVCGSRTRSTSSRTFHADPSGRSTSRSTEDTSDDLRRRRARAVGSTWRSSATAPGRRRRDRDAQRSPTNPLVAAVDARRSAREPRDDLLAGAAGSRSRVLPRGTAIRTAFDDACARARAPTTRRARGERARCGRRARDQRPRRRDPQRVDGPRSSRRAAPPDDHRPAPDAAGSSSSGTPTVPRLPRRVRSSRTPASASPRRLPPPITRTGVSWCVYGA